MNQNKEILSEFEIIDTKKKLSHILISVLFFTSIIALSISYYSPLPNFKISSIYSEPTDLIFLSTFQILPLSIFFAFVLRKKIGWISITSYCIVFIGVLLAATLHNVNSYSFLFTESFYHLLNLTIISILLLQKSIRHHFHLSKRTVRYTLIASLLISVTALLCISISSTNA